MQVVYSEILGGNIEIHSQSCVCFGEFCSGFDFVLTIFHHMVVKYLEDRIDFLKIYIYALMIVLNIYNFISSYKCYGFR